MRGRGGDKPPVAIATMNGRKDSIRGELEVDGVFLASLRAKIKTAYQMEHVAQDAHMTWCVQREAIDEGDENTKASNTKNMYARARSGDNTMFWDLVHSGALGTKGGCTRCCGASY